MVDIDTAVQHTIPLPDYGHYQDNNAIKKIDQHDRYLTLHWQDDKSRFHYVWLRDNCPCELCVYPVTREQIFNLKNLPLDIKPKSCQITDSGALQIIWQDAHKSVYHPDWLFQHRYDNVDYHDPAKIPLREWHNGHIVKRFSINEITEQPSENLAWLECLKTDGITIVEGVEPNKDAVLNVAQKIGMIRDTNFGRQFDVISKADANSNAYTTFKLPLHTDLPTREMPPGIQLLHCLVNNADGGESYMADGLAIARAIEKEQPEAYYALSQFNWDFHNRSRSTDYRAKQPILELDDLRGFFEIRLAHFLRGPLQLPFEQTEIAYRAYLTLIDYLEDERFIIRFALQPGEAMVFNNRRVLHAREAFDPSSGDRHLSGCYVDTEELDSKIRVLKREMKS